MDPTLNQDEFDGAFAEAAGGYDTTTPATTEQPTEAQPTQEQQAAPEAPATETPVAEAAPEQGGETKPAATEETTQAPAASAPEPTAAPTPAPEQTAPVQEAKPDPYAGIDPKFLAQALAEEQAKLQQQAKPQEPQEPQAPATINDFLSEDDKAAVAKLETEWPDEYRAFQRLAQATAAAAIENYSRILHASLNQTLAPIAESVQQTKVSAHLAAIRSAHPDLDTIAPAVQAWMSGQPEFLRAGMHRVWERGTADEVVSLLGMYKAATAPTGAAPATPASSAAQEQQVQPQPAKVPPSALAATAAVPATQRTAKRTAHDPNDFDGGFADALQVL